MNQKGKQAVIGTVLVLLAIVISITIVVIKKFTPSKNIMEITEYYEVANDKVLLVMQNELSETNGLYLDGKVYIDYNTIVEKFNSRFYWDFNENILIYSTPTEVIKTEIGSNNYYVNKSKQNTDYQIVKTEGDTVYVALDYVKQYSNIEYETYENPNRVVIEYKWGEKFLYSEVKKETQLRVEPSIKSDILAELKTNQVLIHVDVEEKVKGSFSKVMTEDGIVGYVKNKNLTVAHYEKLENDYKEEVYTHISKDYTINMVWHQVTNQEANNGLLNALDTTKGLTTISPTWFAISNNAGEISSLASEKYVQRAHNAGVEVWALCDDFNSDVSMYQLLTYTSRREKLSNELIANAIKYNLDGINIDFENIPQEAGIHYIQFIRELSVKCRNNGIVLSVDNYVPAPYSSYYNRKEQGDVVDYVITMAYDEHHASSEESGSVASIGYVSDAVTNILKEVPAERSIIGIPFYTRVWKEVTTDDGTEVSAVAYGMSQALNLLKDYGVEPEWNKDIGQYYGEFEKEGARYRVWLEEDKSIEEKMKIIDESGMAGVAGWKLGLEKESIWNVIVKYTN